MTDKEISFVLNDMLVIVDTREQKNQHILEFFKTNGIAYKIEKLETGDYSFILPSYPKFNFDKKVIIERKGSLNEIAGNFTKDRERLVREFERIDGSMRFHFIMENATWKKISNGSYRSKLSPQSFKASLLTFSIRYKFPVWFCTKEESPEMIYDIMKYELREYIKSIDNH